MVVISLVSVWFRFVIFLKMTFLVAALQSRCSGIAGEPRQILASADGSESEVQQECTVSQERPKPNGAKDETSV